MNASENKKKEANFALQKIPIQVLREKNIRKLL